MDDYFENKDGSIYCKRDCEFIMSKHNVEVLPNGNLNVLLFGNLVIIHDPEKKDNKIYTITLATRVEMSIYAVDQYHQDEEEHFIVMYNEGDKVIEKQTVPVSVDNVEDIFKMVQGGRVSNIIAYYDYYDIIENAMTINENLGFPRILLEIMIAESFVDASGKKLARLTPGDKGQGISIKNSVYNKNTFNSMTFEDWSMASYLHKKKPFSQQDKDPSILETYMRK